MTELNLYQRALNHIENIEYEHGIHMDHEEFSNRNLPAYFNIKIDNTSDSYQGHVGIIYNFEVEEGSAQIVCAYDENEDEIFTLDLNETLKKHIKDKWKIYEYEAIDSSLDVQ